MPAEHRELVLHAHDGTTLFAQRWGPCDVPAIAELLIVPGYADHSGRYRELAHLLCRRGIITTAVDPRGHGRSSGRRGYIESFDDYHADVETALASLSGPKRFLLGHSQGGLIVLDFVSRRQPQVTGAIVTNPYLQLAAPVPRAKLAMGHFLGKVWPTLALKTEIDPAVLSHDQAIVDEYRRDPLVFKVVTPGWLREVTLAQARVSALAELGTSLLYIYSDSDGLALPAASRALSDRLAAPEKTVWVREGEFHEVLNETQRAELHGRIADWVLAHAS